MESLILRLSAWSSSALPCAQWFIPRMLRIQENFLFFNVCLQRILPSININLSLRWPFLAIYLLFPPIIIALYFHQTLVSPIPWTVLWPLSPPSVNPKWLLFTHPHVCLDREKESKILIDFPMMMVNRELTGTSNSASTFFYLPGL